MTYKSLSAISIKDVQVVRNLHIKITTDSLEIYYFELQAVFCFLIIMTCLSFIHLSYVLL